MESSVSTDQLTKLLAVERFPRSSIYDPHWLLKNVMGPNVLWLTEFLCEEVELEPGMRVLDMGCGKAVSSIFLAREFDVEVWATDLWISPDENWQRIREAAMDNRIHPIHAEAHTLPFAADFFDAAVSMDAFHYFGTDDLYLGYYSRFVKPGGQIGIVVPGLRKEVGADIPEHLKPHWVWDYCSFHSPEWWRAHWEKTGLVDVQIADGLTDGWRLWLHWLEVCRKARVSTNVQETETIKADAGRYLGFTRLVGRRRSSPLYGAD